LCIHHCVEGATVGPADFTFRGAQDVIRCADLSEAFAAVLSGHIHRHQVLRTDLAGGSLPTPVLYPGSLDRTAFAEMGEAKGYMLLEAAPGSLGGSLVDQRFVPLPTRPMVAIDLERGRPPSVPWEAAELDARVRQTIDSVPAAAILRIRVFGPVPPQARQVVSAGALRRVIPPEMNLQLLLAEDRESRPRGRAPVNPGSTPPVPGQITLWEVPGP
jgi:hypothetical protein